MAGLLVVDICNHDDAEKLKELVAASVAYWTSEQKGFKLISDRVGSDFLVVNEGSAIKDNVFKPGPTTFAQQGSVALVFERANVAPAAAKGGKKDG